MILIKTFCECGEEIDPGLTIGRQHHVEVSDSDLLFTPITMFTPMNCPKCGRSLGYIGKKIPEVRSCYKQNDSCSGGK